jgi:hypothetical protein
MLKPCSAALRHDLGLAAADARHVCAGERLAQRLNLLRLPSDAERVGRLLD